MFRKFLNKQMPNDIDVSNRDDIKKVAIKFLKRKNYTVVKELGSGGFGDVIAITNKFEDKMMAAKLMHKNKTAPGEVYLWPVLKHPNVMPLIKRLSYKSIDIFIMPYQPLSLFDVLELPEYRQNPQLFKMTIGWLKGVITGLEYLHGYGVCHLDLKPDNILITFDMEAMICDMSGIAETKAYVNTYVLPKCYRPPETWTTLPGERPYVDGQKFDLWSAGLVIFYCFSDRWIESQIDDVEDWFKDIYPLIFKCLEASFFNFLIKRAHPSCKIDKEDCSLALNLLKGILRYRPEDRPTSTEILEHPLFSGKRPDARLLEPDIIWNEKISEISIFEESNQSRTKDLEPGIKTSSVKENEAVCVQGMLSDTPDTKSLDYQGTTSVSDVKEKRKRKNIRQRIQDAFGNLRNFFKRKKAN